MEYPQLQPSAFSFGTNFSAATRLTSNMDAPLSATGSPGVVEKRRRRPPPRKHGKNAHKRLDLPQRRSQNRLQSAVTEKQFAVNGGVLKNQFSNPYFKKEESMIAGNSSKIVVKQNRGLRLAMAVQGGLCVGLFGLTSLGMMSIGNVAQATHAATANGELQGRPAPVHRCPSVPCAFPNVFDISVAVHFNATPAQLTAIQGMITAGSATIFDVTDGQAEIGEAFIYNNAPSTAVADVRIFPCNGTCVADETDVWWNANTGHWKTGGSINVSINYIVGVGAVSLGESFGHEFVHLVFDSRDEYETRPVGCGDPPGAVGSASCPDAAGLAAGQTRCLMDGNAAAGSSSELCWSGNHEPAHVTEHSRCRSNRSCWEQLVWAWPDCFEMPAGGPDPAANGAVVDPTRFVIADAPVRVVLVLDGSGSMSSESPSRMARLKVAANDFITLAENATELGIVTFSDDAVADAQHPNVAIGALNAGQRAACTAAITALTPGGATAIGSGLQAARNMIITAGGVTANTYIVLMTDGLNNRPLPDWDADLDDAVADLLADGIPVFVTCTGVDLGLASQCAAIGTGTGGFSVDSANAADLAQAFTDFHERISGREAVDSASGQLQGAATKSVYVEPGSESVTFALMWRDASASASLTVIDPAGNRHASLPMDQGRFTRLASPAPGTYQLVLTNQGNILSNYVVRAYSRNQIQSLSAALRYPTVLPGQPMYIYAFPRSVGGGITTSNQIAGTVLLPNGQTDTIKLSDRGIPANIDTDGDVIGGDGVFTGIYTNTTMKGPYQFLLRAEMSNWVQSTERRVVSAKLRSPRFTREVRLSGAVGQPSDMASYPRISINEWMAANTKTLLNPFTGQFDDWLELHNPNPFPVNLSDWLLTESLSNTRPYVIPQGFVLAANAYYLVWADGFNSSNAPLRTNFRLSSAGETLSLLAPDGRVIDHVTFGAQTNDISQGRSPNSGPYVFSFTTPTPGGPNPVQQTPVLRASASFSPNGVLITLNTVPGLTYRVEYKNKLTAASWTRLAPAQVATGTTLTVADPPNGGVQRFYRAVVVQ